MTSETEADMDTRPGRFDRMKVEVVSGGTQSPEEVPQASLQTTLLGASAWLALFVLLYISSPWRLVFVIALLISVMLLPGTPIAAAIFRALAASRSMPGRLLRGLP